MKHICKFICNIASQRIFEANQLLIKQSAMTKIRIHNRLQGILFLVLAIGTLPAYAISLDTLKDSLNNTIDHKRYFVIQKEERINLIKKHYKSIPFQQNKDTISMKPYTKNT